jgi:hypothetical protein
VTIGSTRGCLSLSVRVGVVRSAALTVGRLNGTTGNGAGTVGTVSRIFSTFVAVRRGATAGLRSILRKPGKLAGLSLSVVTLPMFLFSRRHMSGFFWMMTEQCGLRLMWGTPTNETTPTAGWGPFQLARALEWTRSVLSVSKFFGGSVDIGHTQGCTVGPLATIGGLMNITEFTKFTAEAVSDSYDIVTEDGYPQIVWALSQEPETILVKTVEGDVFQLHVTRLDA